MNMDSKSILNGRPALSLKIEQIAEAAGYLWQKGWAERNGGNITVNITEYVDDAIRQLPAICEENPIGLTLPHLKGQYFYCKGTGKRMRDLARYPMECLLRNFRPIYWYTTGFWKSALPIELLYIPIPSNWWQCHTIRIS